MNADDRTQMIGIRICGQFALPAADWNSDQPAGVCRRCNSCRSDRQALRGSTRACPWAAERGCWCAGLHGMLVWLPPMTDRRRPGSLRCLPLLCGRRLRRGAGPPSWRCAAIGDTLREALIERPDAKRAQSRTGTDAERHRCRTAPTLSMTGVDLDDDAAPRQTPPARRRRSRPQPQQPRAGSQACASSASMLTDGVASRARSSRATSSPAPSPTAPQYPATSTSRRSSVSALDPYIVPLPIRRCTRSFRPTGSSCEQRRLPDAVGLRSAARTDRARPSRRAAAHHRS